MDPQDSSYNYVPTRWVAILFVVLYGISTFVHVCQGIRFRMWWIFPTIVLAGLTECIGWSGRLWSSFSPSLDVPFLMQITTTILAPTPLVAGNFIILGVLISRLGPVYSRLSPKWYTIIFCSFDFVSLIVQGAGGGLASSQDDPTVGGHIMLGGIIFQMVTMTLYVILASEFLFRYLTDRPLSYRIIQMSQEGNSFRGEFHWKLKAMVSALSFSTLLLFIRAFYRVIELSDGWNGRIISTEVYFNVLDGGMVTLAMYTLNFAHPGWLLGDTRDNRLREKALSSNSNSGTV
ncbi:RTA1-domain-containing protein [Mycena floridula]|nr:RTA1-domain-containing protein [Mycena floridula]